MADPIIVNPLGVNDAQGNITYNDLVIQRYQADPSGNNNAITGLSSVSSSGVVSVSTVAANGFINGQQVTIVGTSTSGGYNLAGTYTATVLGTATFTIPVSTGTQAGSISTTTGASVTQGFFPGQIMQIAGYNGTSSTNYLSSAVPVINVATTTRNNQIVGPLLGGNTPGSVCLPGAVAQVVTSGLAQVYVDATLTFAANSGSVVVQSTTNPGQATQVAASAAVNGQGLGVALQSSGTITAPAKALVWANIARS